MSRRSILRAFVYLLTAAVFLFSMAGPAIKRSLGLFFDGQATTCLPWRLFVVRPLADGDELTPRRAPPVRRGDLVTFDTDAMRAIDPNSSVLKLKMLAATAGDRVSVKGRAFWINGRYWGQFALEPWVKERGIRPDPVAAPWWGSDGPKEGEWEVPPGKVLLLGTEPLSFDARYWGWQDEKIISGRALPIF